MTVQIDILTIIFVLSAINMIAAVFFTIHLRVTHTKAQLRYFIASKVLQGLSWLLRLLFYASPQHVMILMADWLLVAGFCSESILFVQYTGGLNKRTRLFYGLSMGLSSILIFGLWNRFDDIKNLVSLFAYLTYMAMAAWPLLLRRDATQFQRFLGFCYAALPIVSVSLYVAITDEVTTQNFVTSEAGILYYISILFMQMVGSIGYLLMVKEVDELRLYELATKDYLTGILNRKAFYDYADVHFQNAAIHHQPISFAIIDIDHFKKVNDTYGHQVGDEVLKQLTAFLTSTLRKHDILARFGGEEFVICLPGVDDKEALPVLERLQVRLLNEWSSLSGKSPRGLPTFTLSIGLSSGTPKIGDSIDDFLKRSDEALYYCKNNGRNCIAASSSPYHAEIRRLWP